MGECPTVCTISINDERYVTAYTSFRRDQAEVTADFALIQPATISGDIRIGGEIPTDDIYVSLSFRSDSGNFWQQHPLLRHEQENGRYLIGRIPPGTPYRLCAGGLDANTVEQCFDGHNRTSFSVDPDYDFVTPGEGEHRDGIDFDLISGGSISGTLHDAYRNAPLADTPIDITYFDDAGERLGSSRGSSDAVGRYRFQGLPDGAFYAVANIDSMGPFLDGRQLYPGIVCEPTCPPVTNGQRLSITGGSSLTSIDFTVHPDIVIKGRISDATNGKGRGGVSIQTSNSFRPSAVSDEETGEFMFYKSSSTSPFRIFTRDAQPYIDQLYPGIPCIRHFLSQCGEGAQTFNPPRGSVVENVDFALQPGAAISGTIRDAATGSTRGGHIYVYDSDFTVVWDQSIDESGAYLSGAWYPGTYYVKAVTGYPTGCAFYDARPCPAEGEDPTTIMPTPLQMGAHEIRGGIDFHLGPDTVFSNGFEPTELARGTSTLKPGRNVMLRGLSRRS
jgi:hypothetical protein